MEPTIHTHVLKALFLLLMVQDVKQPQNIALADSNIKDQVDLDLRTKVSRYISYLLRHNPEDLKINKHGLVGY